MKAKTLFKALLGTVFFISLTGCGSSGSDDSTGGNKGIGSSNSAIGGSYHIISMISDKGVDLNNDGLISTDLLNEIDPSFFDPNSPELVINPVIYNNQLEEMMNFYLPHPTVTVNTPGKLGGVKFTRNGLGYIYNIDENTQDININKGGMGSTATGIMNSIKVTGKNTLQAILQKDYYDFSTAKWQLLTITVIYRKV